MRRLARIAGAAFALALAAGAVQAAPKPVKPGVEARFTDMMVTWSDTWKPEGTTTTAPAVTYYNPILPGYRPDPSIVRDGDDYYMVNSTFAFYPGIPVYHSKDLFTWEQVGNAIDRPGMLDFSGLGTSRGVFAPDITVHKGRFYILNTCVDCGGNFVITAKKAKGPWSDPVWLPFDGIDPSLFWDDDGRAYIVNNGPPDGEPQYNGHRALWMQEFDPKTSTLIGPRQVIVDGGADFSQKPIWIEGPHVFRKDGFYYLIAAEGGTESNHSEVVFRSDKVFGPYVPYSGNPILTQRDLAADRPDPVESTGHAQLVETKDGQWWSVFLGTRPYAPRTQDQQGLFNTGRETFLAPVTWTKDEAGASWPVILPKGQAVPRTLTVPGTAATTAYLTSFHSGYDHHGSKLEWLQVRTPKTPFLAVDGDMTMTLTALPEALGDVTSHPAFAGLRQQQPHARMNLTLTYRPVNEGDRAGIVALQSDDAYLFYGLAMRDGKEVLEVTRRASKDDPRDGVVIARTPVNLPDDRVLLTIDINGGKAKFSWHLPDQMSDFMSAYGMVVDYADNATTSAEDVDVTNLSTAKAGGFVGTIIGPYAYRAKP